MPELSIYSSALQRSEHSICTCGNCMVIMNMKYEDKNCYYFKWNKIYYFLKNRIEITTMFMIMNRVNVRNHAPVLPKLILIECGILMK